jgi:hypothetical protein
MCSAVRFISVHPVLSFDVFQSLTRFDPAALLLSCCARIFEATKDLKSLFLEIKKGHPLYRRRADPLDANPSTLARDSLLQLLSCLQRSLSDFLPTVYLARGRRVNMAVNNAR